MIYTAIDILILSAFLLIVGRWNPKILFFWLDKPSRFAVVMLVSVLVMVSLTLDGEGTREKQLEQKLQQAKQAQQIAKESQKAAIAAKSDAQTTEAAPEITQSPTEVAPGDNVQNVIKPVTEAEKTTLAETRHDAPATSSPETAAIETSASP